MAFFRKFIYLFIFIIYLLERLNDYMLLLDEKSKNTFNVYWALKNVRLTDSQKNDCLCRLKLKLEKTFWRSFQFS